MTTETEEVPTTRKISVKFNRSVSDGSYGSTGGEMWVSGDVSVDASLDDIIAEGNRLFSAAKATVFGELAIPFHMDEETLVLHEDAAPVTPARVAQAYKAAPVAESASGGTLTIANPDEASSEPLPEWIFAETKKLGITKIYDNRETRDVEKNQPYFKEWLERGAKNGHGKDGGSKGFWPPK